jgi:hypothetical protein
MARVLPDALPAELLKQLIGSNPRVRRGRDVSLYESAMGFYHAVRWGEPWIVGLLCAHVLYAAVVVGTRRHQGVQFALFLCTCAAVYAAQPLNGYLQRNWRGLGFTQDYFDRRGVFMSCLYSGPLLLIAFAQLVSAEESGAAAPSARARTHTPPLLTPHPRSPRPPPTALRTAPQLQPSDKV